MYWKSVGRVNYDFYEERLHGILDLESYTDDDWEKYGDNVALSKVCSNECSITNGIETYVRWNRNLCQKKLHNKIEDFKKSGILNIYKGKNNNNGIYKI